MIPSRSDKKAFAEYVHAVMLAEANGATIECRDRGYDKWARISAGPPLWNWSTHDYRVKPEPIEGWVNLYGDSYGYLYKTKEEAVALMSGVPIRTIKVREVEEDE